MTLSRVVFIVVLAATPAATAWSQLAAPLRAPQAAERAARAANARTAQTNAAQAAIAGRPARPSALVKTSSKRPRGDTRAATRPFTAVGKRDPFKSIIQKGGGVRGPDCPASKQCLVPGLLVLKGTVKGPEGMLAVVENQQRKAYFLRENDPVFNGRVVRITMDSIVFREKVLDRLGHETTHEVIKQMPVRKPLV